MHARNYFRMERFDNFVNENIKKRKICVTWNKRDMSVIGFILEIFESQFDQYKKSSIYSDSTL